MDQEDREHYQQQVAEHARLGTDHWCEDFGCESVKKFLDALDVSESECRRLREDARALAQFVKAYEARWDGMPSAYHEDAVKLLARPGVRRLEEEK